MLAIAASDRNGELASYSAGGSNVTVVAPGGEIHAGILTTSNTGLTLPVGETSAGYYGTSNSTAIVSGIVSLILTANPALQPSGVENILKATAVPIASCASKCGSGRVDANAAVRMALQSVTPPAASAPAVAAAASSSSGGGGGGGGCAMTAADGKPDPSLIALALLAAMGLLTGKRERKTAR